MVTGNPDSLIDPIANLFFNPALLFGGMIGLFFVFILIWIISTIGEVSLIKGVSDFDSGLSSSLGEMLSAGVKLLVRIIAIDTVIFFPLFLILLFQLLAIGGGMIGGFAFLAQPGNNPDELLPIAAVVGLILLFLTILAIPVTILTILFRLLAFRSAILEDLPTRPSIRRAWALIRAKPGEIIIIALLLYAVSYAVGMITSMLVLPFSFGGIFLFLGPVSPGQPPSFPNLDGFLTLMTLASVVAILPNLVYRVFYSAVWTLAYKAWQGD